MQKSIVYFIKDITKQNLVRIYKELGINLPGKVAIKVHSGEAGNQNYLRPEFMSDIIDYVGGTIVECNTAYKGERNSTEKHLKIIASHGWQMYDFDLLDETGPDLVLNIPNGKVIKENYVGKNITKYDSMLVLSHFKGHPMGGFGGALKQLSIGCASSQGKSWIHSAGFTLDQNILWDNLASQRDFIEAMADAASSIVKLFQNKIAYINVMCNISVDCDCCKTAEDPCIPDVGILASLDPVAIDRACIDLIRNSNFEGKNHLLERIESRQGEHIIEAAKDLGIGTDEYILKELD